MPTYEYTCAVCEKTVELANIKIDERDLQLCVECGNKLIRSWTLGNMSVWAPTSGGFR